jgi:hypothetical protein
MENEKNESNPCTHTARIKTQLEDLSNHLREDVGKMNDAQAKALFEVSAEVIDGLHKAFSDYEKKNEKAWTKDGQ